MSQVIGKYPHLQAAPTPGDSTCASQDFAVEFQWFPGGLSHMAHVSRKGGTVRCRDVRKPISAGPRSDDCAPGHILRVDDAKVTMKSRYSI